MENLVKLYGRLDRFNQWVGQTTSWLAIPIIVVIMWDVVSRRFFASGSVVLQELEWHFHAVLFLFCSGYTYLHDGHVRVDLVRVRLSKKWQAWIELIGSVAFLIPYCIVIIYFGIVFVLQSYGLNESSDAPSGLPFRYLIKASLPIAFVFLFLQGVSVALKQVVFLFGGAKSQEGA